MTQSRGFTLVELIIYISILSLVVVGLVSFALSMTSVRAKVYVGQEVGANARIALDVITQKIRAAQSINMGASTFAPTNPGTLSLKMADGSRDPTIINLDALNGRLQIKEGVASPVFITGKEVRISNLIFTNLSQTGERGHIRIDLGVGYANPSSAVYTYSWSGATAVSLRQ
jgi:type II secretory pathway pseudopilin PulG